MHPLPSLCSQALAAALAAAALAAALTAALAAAAIPAANSRCGYVCGYTWILSSVFTSKKYKPQFSKDRLRLRVHVHKLQFRIRCFRMCCIVHKRVLWTHMCL